MTVTFDPVGFKQTTRAQWEAAADAWDRWGPTIESWLGPATETMLGDGGVTTGSRVLDVAAGAGGQTLVAARAVGPSGRVLATDISPAILEYAAAAAAAAGLANVDTLEADGEDLSKVEPGSFDAAISRVGLIYFPDQQAALAEICRALRPGGRVSAVVYSTADRNPFFSIPVGIIRRIAELPPPLPGQPGPFSLGAQGVAEQVFRDAGLTDVSVTACPSPFRLASAAECVRFERESFGALGTDALQGRRGRAGARVGRDHRAAHPVRGAGRLRQPLRDAGCERDPLARNRRPGPARPDKPPTRPGSNASTRAGSACWRVETSRVSASG